MDKVRAHLKKIIKENGPDRVRAVLALARLQNTAVSDYAPPPYNARPALIDAVVRVMRSAGRDVCTLAWNITFGPSDTIATGGSPGDPPEQPYEPDDPDFEEAASKEVT